MNTTAKTLILVGVLLVVIGLLWQLAGRFVPLGRLPGDIVIEGERSKFYFPIVTCLILSVALSLVLTVWRMLSK